MRNGGHDTRSAQKHAQMRTRAGTLFPPRPRGGAGRHRSRDSNAAVRGRFAPQSPGDRPRRTAGAEPVPGPPDPPRPSPLAPGRRDADRATRGRPGRVRARDRRASRPGRRGARARLVLRPDDLAPARARRGCLPVGGPAGERGPPREAGSAGPAGLLPAGPRRHRDRPPVRHRAVRHDPVLAPHGPARDPDLPRRAGDRAVRPDHAGPACRHAAGPSALGPARARLTGGQGDRPPARRVGPLHRRDVGNPLLAALRRHARERLAARPGARAVPGQLHALLDAGRGPRPEPVAVGLPGADPLPVRPDAAQLVPRGRHPLLRDDPVPALRDHGPPVGSFAAAGPAGGRRDHVGPGRRRIPARPAPAHRGVDALRRGGDAPPRVGRGCPGRGPCRRGGGGERGVVRACNPRVPSA